MRPPGFPGNPPARMPRAPTPARSPPPRPLRGGDVAFRPTHDVGPRDQCISGLNHAAYALPVNASRPRSPQAHASLGSGWWPTLAGWGWIPTGFRRRFRRSHLGILSPLTGLSRHTRWCMNRNWPARCPPTESSPADAIRHGSAEDGHPIQDLTAEECSAPGFLDSGLTVFASMLPRPARRSHVAPERGFDSGTSLASTARCTSA